MSHTIHGTCSTCGGAVTTPFAWYGVVPPVPTCSSCGATAANPYGPTIPMQPRRCTVTTNSTAVQDLQEWIDKEPARRTRAKVDTAASARYGGLMCNTATERIHVRTVPRSPRREFDVDTTSVAP